MQNFIDFLKKFWLYAEKAKNFFTTFVFVMVCFFLFLLVLILVSLPGKPKRDIIKFGSALYIEIKDRIPEKVANIETLTEIVSTLEKKDEPLSLNELIVVIQQAKDDPKIKGIVLKTDSMSGTGLTKMRLLTQALQEFKSSGKPIIAINDNYTQEQYFLASSATKLYMNNLGLVELHGFGNYRLFFKDALEKMKIQVHVFRVGTFKAAMEPFFRNDMSEEAKIADGAWLDDLWNTYKNELKLQRPILKIDDIDAFINNIDKLLIENKGDIVSLALKYGFIDEALSREEMDRNLIALFGSDDKDVYNRISANKYYKFKNQKPIFSNAEYKIALVFAQGSILDGDQSERDIGGETYARIIRKVRLDSNVKALVLRIDSGGGSVFASELIRKEVEAFKLTGRPVVASFSSVAASGGYWIATPADEIWASPTTITGSIGIFGAIPTFDKLAESFGFHTDGVGTTKLASGVDLLSPLNPMIANVMQSSIEHGYDAFVTLVANSRNMTKEAVDKIAQGRVWTGTKAKEIGLVDQLGGLQEAIQSAAKLAKLSEYEIVVFEKELDDKIKLLKAIAENVSSEQLKFQLQEMSPVESKLLKYTKDKLNFLRILTDPQNLYSYSFLENVP